MKDECSLKDVLRTIAGILPGVEMELPIPSNCATGRLERGAEGLPTAKVEGLRGRHHGRHGRLNEELAGIAEKVMQVKKMEIGKKGLKLSIAEGRKEGKSKVIASCSYLEENQENCSKEGVEMSTKVDMLGVDWRKRTKQLVAKEKARRSDFCSSRRTRSSRKGI